MIMAIEKLVWWYCSKPKRSLGICNLLPSQKRYL